MGSYMTMSGPSTHFGCQWYWWYRWPICSHWLLLNRQSHFLVQSSEHIDITDGLNRVRRVCWLICRWTHIQDENYSCRWLNEVTWMCVCCHLQCSNEYSWHDFHSFFQNKKIFSLELQAGHASHLSNVVVSASSYPVRCLATQSFNLKAKVKGMIWQDKVWNCIALHDTA